MPIIPAFDPDTGASGGPVVPVPSPVTPPAATSEAVASGGTPAPKTFGAFTDPDGQIATYSAAIVNAVGTTSIASGSGLGPYDVSGYADEDGYALTLTALDAGGAPLATAVHAVTIAAAAAGGTYTWLNMPNKVHMINTVPSPDPSGYAWDEPTNGVGPYTYEVVAIQTQGHNTWNNYDLQNRLIFATRPTIASNDSLHPLLFRVRAFDSVGNWGDGYVFIFLGINDNNIIYDEVVLEEQDPPVTYTVPAFGGTYKGTGSDTFWSHVEGSGIMYPHPMKDTTNTTLGRYQGPFTIDPAPGASLFFTTAQRATPSSGTTKYIVQSFRRKRNSGMTRIEPPWQTVLDYDLKAIGTTSPASWPVPITVATTSNIVWTQPGFGPDCMLAECKQLGTGTTTLEQNYLNSNGMGVRIECAASSNRGIQASVRPRVFVSHTLPSATSPMIPAVRGAVVGVQSDVVMRFYGRVSLTGTSPSVRWFMGNVSSQGAWINFGRSSPIGGVPIADIVVFGICSGGSFRLGGNIPNTNINGLDIGVDIYISGAGRYAVVYVSDTPFPNLNGTLPNGLPDPNPYANLKHWVMEGGNEGGSEQSTAFAGTTGGDLFMSGEFAVNRLLDPFVGTQARAGNNGAAVVETVLYRTALLHRPRSMRKWS